MAVRTEETVRERLRRGEPFCMIVPQQLVKEVDPIGAGVVPVIGRDKFAPRHLGVAADGRTETTISGEPAKRGEKRPGWSNGPLQQLVVIRLQVEAVLCQVMLELVRPEHLDNLQQLIVIVPPAEEVLSPEELRIEGEK